MQPITPTDATRALNLLAEAAVEREQELQQYAAEPEQSDSDEETDSDMPIFDQFYEQGGSAAIVSMTNFDPQKLFQIWEAIEDYVIEQYTTGRGCRSSVKPKDLFFMTVCVFKHGGEWHFLARTFNMKGPTFERLIMGFVLNVSEYIYKHFVVDNENEFRMAELMKNRQQFSHFKCARYATDVTFQMAFRPSGNIQEGKKYYSGKHKLYGYKVEVSVLPNGLALCCSKHYPGSVSDLEIFQRMRNVHSKYLRKNEADLRVNDVDPLVAEHPNLWAVLVDKGYQGAPEFCRTIQPVKKRANQRLSLSDERFNKKVSSDRIIVENFFGRVCGLWSVLQRKWRWSEQSYDIVFRFCVALTNLHIRWHPLREEDYERFQRIKNRHLQIGVQQVEKRKRTLERYRQKRRRRMDVQFRAQAFPDREPEDDM